MIRILPLCLCLLLLTNASVSAQELRADKVVLLETDKEAELHPRYDRNGGMCALLKVYINDLSGLKFASNFVIDKENVVYKDGYYAVYVIAGIRDMMLKHDDYLPVTIRFKKDFQIAIKGGKTYRVDVSAIGMVQKNTQTVAFNMLPRDGKLLVNGEEYLVSEGILQLELEPGEYSYVASADYCQPKEGTLSVTDISGPQIIPLSLKPLMANVNFVCNVPTAKWYVDNSDKGEAGMKMLPMGKHRIRVKADNWKDFVQNVVIDKVEGQELVVAMQPKSIVAVSVKVNGAATPYLYVDNKEVKGWTNGAPIRVKLGKHLITVKNGDSYNAATKEKVVRVVPDMQPLEFSF